MIGAFSALFAFGIHGLFVSVHHTIPTSLWVLMTIVGTVICPQITSATRIETARGWFSGLSLLVALVAWLGLWVNISMDNGVAAANAGVWEKAIEYLEIAVTRDG